MIEKQTIIDQVGITRYGYIQIRLGLLLIEDGAEETDCKWHRTSIQPGGDVDAQITAVNANLVQMGKASVDQADIDRVKAIVAVVHTPEVVSAFKAAQEAAK